MTLCSSILIIKLGNARMLKTVKCVIVLIYAGTEGNGLCISKDNEYYTEILLLTYHSENL